jgi:magnesium transporter
MSEVRDPGAPESVQHHLQEIQELLDKQRLVAALVHKQAMPRHELVESLLHKQHLAELQKKLEGLHPADIAYILEALPLEDRLAVWDLVKADRDGEILLEVSEPVRETLIAHMEPAELVAAAESLDTDELADLAPDLPEDVMQDVFRALPLEEREQLRAAMSYAEGSVGALMDFDLVTIRDGVTLETVLRYLRRLDELPDHTDQIFVVDRNEHLRGVLPVNVLLVNDTERRVGEVMKTDMLAFTPSDSAAQAAQAFERYDLVSAPVVAASDRKLIGRVSVDAVLDFIRQAAENERLALGGLRHEEDIFASVWASARNRWAWLGVNLVTAFIASRVISVFEGSIEKLVALAALMPIVAGIGGNTGNQTITMIVRALALGQINEGNARKLILKEVAIAVLNGAVWGGILGVLAMLLYRSVALGVVMMAAMTLNMLVAALFGVFIPLIMHKLGRDPAVGSSVLITAITDSGGFLIFLGLATLVLL